MRQIAELFATHGVEYLVIGRQAETLFGSPRVTYDVDLCYRRAKENLARLAEAMKSPYIPAGAVPTPIAVVTSMFGAVPANTPAS